MGRDTQSQSGKENEIDFNGAAILNDDGTETPITEEMVREACQKLDSDDNEQPSV